MSDRIGLVHLRWTAGDKSGQQRETKLRANKTDQRDSYVFSCSPFTIRNF